MRDHDSTTYLSGFMNQSEFGIGLRRDAIRRGLFSAGRCVLLIDGASGLERLGHDYFPDAIQIVDFYHALGHVYDLIGLLMPTAPQKALDRRRRGWKKLLARGGVSRIIAIARREAAAAGKLQEVEAALGYLINNVARMQYSSFRQQGLFIGSGVIEAGCKSLVGQRCKQSGMFWSLQGAEATLALRCIHAGRQTDTFWKDRLNHRAALNDSLALTP